MIYDAVHEIFSTLLIDYADIPLYFQPLIILFELMAVYAAFRWVFYPLRMILQLVRRLQYELFPSNREKRSRSRKNDDDDE